GWLPAPVVHSSCGLFLTIEDRCAFPETLPHDRGTAGSRVFRCRHSTEQLRRLPSFVKRRWSQSLQQRQIFLLSAHILWPFRRTPSKRYTIQKASIAFR